MILVFSKSKTPFTVAFAVVYEKKRGFDNDFAQFSKNLVTTAIKLLIFVKKRGKIIGKNRLLRPRALSSLIYGSNEKGSVNRHGTKKQAQELSALRRCEIQRLPRAFGRLGEKVRQQTRFQI